jgi:hypothetical protein
MGSGSREAPVELGCESEECWAGSVVDPYLSDWAGVDDPQEVVAASDGSANTPLQACPRPGGGILTAGPD